MKKHALEWIVQRASYIAIGLIALQGWLFPALSTGAQAAGGDTGVESAAAVTAVITGGEHVRSIGEDGTVVCRHATDTEKQGMVMRAPTQALHVIMPTDPQELPSGLRIILRATEQLEQFPQAREGFIRAAQIWENLIASPITVVIDVDFGPMRFGMPYSPRTLGSTRSQLLTAPYPAVRSALIAGASSAVERALYEALPVNQIPTDLGNTPVIVGDSAIFRALDLIPRVANPEQEFETFGEVPSIGFNSAFDFDFNPEDGIDFDKTDFIGVALHEIGHALGFTSANGLEEVLARQPDALPVLTLWDLFRFRPGAGFEFTTALRSLISGGEQVFFADGPELSLSTGGFAGAGGDGRQSSHWKDDDLSGFYLGIMDPTLPPGKRVSITDSDLMALDAMGYTIQNDPTPIAIRADDHAVSVSSLR